MATGIVPKFEASHLGTACGYPGAARRKDKKDTNAFLAFLVNALVFLMSIWCQAFECINSTYIMI
jgi:hypothetical protein